MSEVATVPSPTRDVSLRVERLRVETGAGADIVDEVSFTVQAGTVLALVGESGCGKTSTALALLGHARPGTRIAAGSIGLDGQDLLRLTATELRRARGARIAYVPQDPTASLNPRHRIGHQIMEVLRVHGTSSSMAARVVGDLVQRVGLPDDAEFLRRYPFELSGGQQQRVAIAMALACNPRVIVLDEPTTGLDVTTQARILDLLRELRTQSGAAFVYVTHDLAVVDGIADRVAVMYAGRIVEVGHREQVLRQPAHPYTALLLNSVPRLARRQRLSGIAGTAPAPGARPHGCFFAPRCPIVVEQCWGTFPPETMVEPEHGVRCWRASEVATVAPRVPPLVELARAGEVLLSVTNLIAAYGQGGNRQAVLHGVSFSVSHGECLAVVGESGSGKTTLGRCVVGLHRPDAGALTLRGTALAPFATARTQTQRQMIQIVFQNPDRSLNPQETVANAIARPLRLFALLDSAGERQQVANLLERVRLPRTVLDRYPRELSGGEKQRVAIARALAARPGLLICDEITSSLDVSIQAAIVDVLNDLRRDGLALLFITHNLALVNALADRVLVLRLGRVCETGATATVIGRPVHPYTQQMLAVAPELGVAPGPHNR